MGDRDERFVTLERQVFKPGERTRRLLPLAFCRECGEEYYTVFRLPAAPTAGTSQGTPAILVPRPISAREPA